MSAYRESCERCRELEAKLAEAKVAKTALPEFQRYPNARCPSCAHNLYYSGGERIRTIVFSGNVLMDRFCDGYVEFLWMRWRRRCPQEPHVHRTCRDCGAEWIEQTAEKVPCPA